MKTKKAFLLIVFMTISIAIQAQNEIPTINPTATFTTPDGKTEEGDTYSGSAPLVGTFAANPSNVGSYTANYEWRFYLEGQEETPFLTRYEEETEYTFTTAGAHYIICYATFINGTDTVRCDKEFYSDNDKSPFSVTIWESKLEMPNAFSPNGQEPNDIYRAKRDYQSIVEFHAYIFNRWGQKLYEWDNIAEGWDGTYNGKPVKQGVYYCLVKAKGADGRKFNIRTDVNLLRGFSEKSTNSDSNP